MLGSLPGAGASELGLPVGTCEVVVPLSPGIRVFRLGIFGGV